MQFNDIYGTFEITEPVLIDLINSQGIQRLKGIAQFGMPADLYSLEGFSRYDHSIGVMLLLKRLGASLEEQIAGLLHDASHTAFSHLVDWVIGDREQEDFQDKNHKMIIERSDIPSILEKYGIDVDKVYDIESFSLLEQHAPDLCADRVDYALREFHLWVDPSVVQKCVSHLINHDGKIMFSSKEAAHEFARAYLKCQRHHWGAGTYKVRWEVFARVLKQALEEEVIVFEDFYHDDDHVLNKLRMSNDPVIKERVDYLQYKFKINNDVENPEFVLKKKFRWVDPEYVVSGKSYRLSEQDKNFKEFLVEEEIFNKKGMKGSLA